MPFSPMRLAMRLADASSVARNLQAALDRWDEAEPELRALDDELAAGRIATDPVVCVFRRKPITRSCKAITRG